MSFIEENNEIPEMYMLRHKHDSYVSEHGYDYTNNLFKNTVSPVLFNNTLNDEILNKLSYMFVTLIDTIQPIRNIFFYTHNKYYNKHGR